MKKIVDDERLIYKVCCLYYQDNMNQKEIGDYLGVSRSSVLRMLQKGKELGIVKIKLNNPSTFDYGEMEKKLENMYGLKDVLIVENSVLDSKTEAASYLFGQAADYLYNFFKEGDQIGVTMGQTLNNVWRAASARARWTAPMCRETRSPENSRISSEVRIRSSFLRLSSRIRWCLIISCRRKLSTIFWTSLRRSM